MRGWRRAHMRSVQKLSLKNGGKKLWRCLRYGEWRWGLRSSSLWPHNAVVHVPTLHTVCVYPHYRKMWNIRMNPCVPSIAANCRKEKKSFSIFPISLLFFLLSYAPFFFLNPTNNMLVKAYTVVRHVG